MFAVRDGADGKRYLTHASVCACDVDLGCLGGAKSICCHVNFLTNSGARRDISAIARRRAEPEERKEGHVVNRCAVGPGLIFLSVILLLVPAAQAQTDVLIETELSRKDGNSPVYQRAVLLKPNGPADTALMFFRGGHGLARISSAADARRNLPFFVGPQRRLFSEAGIALVVMDCPTDQWFDNSFGMDATRCLDDYRSSAQHADDVRGIISKLRNEHGFSRIFVMGHSKGSVSSRWLAVHLGNEISGSIHTGAMTVANPKGFAQSASRIPYASVAAPILHVQHKDDSCRVTPHAGVERYAGNNLTTVRGGTPEGDPCGGGHYHSFRGREEIVARAIISWIKTGKVEPVIGE